MGVAQDLPLINHDLQVYIFGHFDDEGAFSHMYSVFIPFPGRAQNSAWSFLSEAVIKGSFVMLETRWLLGLTKDAGWLPRQLAIYGSLLTPGGERVEVESITNGQ